MSVLGQLTRASSFDDAAAAIIGEAQRRGYSRDEQIAVLADAIQESGLRPTAVSPNGKWRGIYQQDDSYPGRDDPNENIRGFFDRLDAKRRSPGASKDPWLNIFWLQQRPGEKSAALAYANGRKAYLTEIKSRAAAAAAIVDRHVTGAQPMTWTGDPVWLEDVLRSALGGKLKTLPDWQDYGHGDFGPIWGVMVHHTGNGAATAQSIRDGRPDLAGPLSNLHIAQDGTVTVVAGGVGWHAGAGSYPGIPTNGGNQVLIGIECAWPRDTSLTPATQTRERWPDAEIISMRDTVAAILTKLGVDSSRVIGHKEYAGAAQGKWDPGNLDMGWFRGEVAKAMRGEFTKPTVPTPTPPADDQLTLRWKCLGGQTLVEAVAEIRDKVLGTDDRLKTGVQ